jgi:hypothetical protein
MWVMESIVWSPDKLLPIVLVQDRELGLFPLIQLEKEKHIELQNQLYQIVRVFLTAFPTFPRTKRTVSLGPGSFGIFWSTGSSFHLGMESGGSMPLGILIFSQILSIRLLFRLLVNLKRKGVFLTCISVCAQMIDTVNNVNYCKF